MKHRLPGLSVIVSPILLAVATWASGQDVVKVSPETHSVLLENDDVRVLSVRLKPGEKVEMHSHPANVVYVLGAAKIRLTGPDGKTEERDLKEGATVWSPGTAHAVENIGSTGLREVQIELKRARKAK